jgi:hypothetical protein
VMNRRATRAVYAIGVQRSSAKTPMASSRANHRLRQSP